MKTGLLLSAAVATCICFGSAAASAATLVAQYDFNNNFNSSVSGAPSLTEVDPTGTSSFGVREGATVYNFNGAASPTNQQGGLVFDNSGGLLTSNSYSIFMRFGFDGGTNAWRRIVDVQNRQSDNGFYVDPGNNLDIFPVTSSSSGFSTGEFHDVLLTVASNGDVRGYLDGDGANQVLFINTTVMNINNPQNVVNLFLDNVVGGGQAEWAPGFIDQARFYDGVVTFDEVAAVPEASTWAMIMLGFAGVGFIARRRSRKDHGLLAAT